jgi:hypothetical protein
MTKTRLLTDSSAQKVAADESELKRAFAAQGSRGFWQQVRVVQQDRWLPGGFFAAQIAARLGETDAALELLQHGYQQRLDYINWIKVDPTLDPLRSDPRFATLLRSMGLDPQSGAHSDASRSFRQVHRALRRGGPRLGSSAQFATADTQRHRMAAR